MRKKALVLVDLQNDFCPGGALAVPGGDEVIDVANRMQEHFDLVVATQDWHPADHKSFAANHPGKEPGQRIELAGMEQVLWPAHCVQGTPGAELVRGLDRKKIARVFQKGTDPEIDSYSGFYDNGHRKATGLTEFLREREVIDVYILGLATDYCVKFTALDARRDGFSAYLIEDGCRGVELDQGDVDRAIEELRRDGVAILQSGQIGP
jgi:nicotinamidase/pyrazinamidase